MFLHGISVCETNTHQGNSSVADGLGFFPPSDSALHFSRQSQWVDFALKHITTLLSIRQSLLLYGPCSKAMGRAEGRVSFSSLLWMLCLGRAVTFPTGGRQVDPSVYTCGDALWLPPSAAPASHPVVLSVSEHHRSGDENTQNQFRKAKLLACTKPSMGLIILLTD